jgi:hypothetical protein
MMASQKLPNCGVGVYAYLCCNLRHLGVPYVRLIPQVLRVLHLGLFAAPSHSMTFCETIIYGSGSFTPACFALHSAGARRFAGQNILTLARCFFIFYNCLYFLTKNYCQLQGLLDDNGNKCYLLMFSARVAELVDALDLGSSALRAWGFNSPLSHQFGE